jgi:hypothetical protein
MLSWGLTPSKVFDCLESPCSSTSLLSTGTHRHERAMGHRERATFIGFKGDLLRQHHIASDEVALRNEAPFADPLPRVAQFLNVGLGAVVYPVVRAGIAADDVEIPEALVARALLWREPFLQQGQRSRLGLECTRPPQRNRFEGTRPRKRRKQQHTYQGEAERAYRKQDLLAHCSQPPTRRG